MEKRIKITLEEIKEYARALHCPTRWRIIHMLGKGRRSTKEIREGLEKVCGSTGKHKQNLYYHLSELSSASIIEVADYREEGGGAPEKVWRLAVEEITIDLLGGELENECRNRETEGEEG